MSTSKLAVEHQADHLASKGPVPKIRSSLPTDLEILTADVGEAVVTYSRKQPAVVACMIFAVGFFVGWKIKPW